MDKISKRIHDNYNAKFSFDEDVILHIVARCQEVDTGARNIENILTKTILPDMARECLSKLSENAKK